VQDAPEHVARTASDRFGLGGPFAAAEKPGLGKKQMKSAAKLWIVDRAAPPSSLLHHLRM